MAEFSFLIFAANNLVNPQNPGFLPAEDNTFRSDLVIGDEITWNGGGESAFITVEDPTDSTFDEAQANQTLVDPVTFDGISYSTGQVVTPTYVIVFSGSDGNSYTMTSFNFSGNTNNEVPDAVFWEGAIPPSGTVLTVTSEINPASAGVRDYSTFVTCFCEGTLIETATGPVPVEHLRRGDQVVLDREGVEEVVLMCSRKISAAELRANPKLRPVVITKGALGSGLPRRDLRVSRQHRMYVRSPICKRMFGQDQVLVAAIFLTQLPGIYVDEDITEVSYHHVILPQHEVLLAEGAPSESLYFGSSALAAMTPEAYEEIVTVFPNLKGNTELPKSACFIPMGNRQKRLVARHCKNSKPLLASYS